MFTKTAQFYDSLYHFKDYSAASKQLHVLIQQLNPNAQSLLDIGCGTGKHLECLQKYYQVEGLDINPELLEIAHKRCPEIPFHQENMVNFNIGHRFDIVTCLFSSIGYVKTVKNLYQTITSIVRHLNSGGIIVVEPWFSPENYWVGRVTANFVEQPELKIAWMYTSELEGRLSVFNINYLVGTPKGITHFTERHEMGLFKHEEYLEAFHKVGFKVSYDSKGLFGRGMYIALENKT